MTPTMPTAKWQDLDQECLPTRNTSLESQHISAKYTRYLKAAQGEVGYNNQLRDFSQFSGILNSSINVVTSTFQATKQQITKTNRLKVLEYLANCNFANLLVCRTKWLSFNHNTSSKNF